MRFPTTLLNAIQPNNGKIVEIAKKATDIGGIRNEIKSWTENYKFMSNAAKKLEIQISSLANARPLSFNDIYKYQSEFHEVRSFVHSLIEESRKCISNLQNEKSTKSEIQKLSVLSNQEFEKLYRELSSDLSAIEGRIENTIRNTPDPTL